MITILGPTACGKTELAVAVAHKLKGEILSADSRQIYRKMDIGTGKDLDEYIVDGQAVPYHLIDLKEPGYHYNLFEFLTDFHAALQKIIQRGQTPVFCGGTGMYIKAVLAGSNIQEAPKNDDLRKKLSAMSIEELNNMLISYRALHNTTDSIDKERLIRALEIEMLKKPNSVCFRAVPSQVFGILYPREEIRDRISKRLRARLESGMIEEVDKLLEQGISPDALRYYGLEYRYITDYLMKILSKEEMIRLLEIAIHQFAKRQMTWFRKMEREGVTINWIDGYMPLKEKTAYICKIYKTQQYDTQ